MWVVHLAGPLLIFAWLCGVFWLWGFWRRGRAYDTGGGHCAFSAGFGCEYLHGCVLAAFGNPQRKRVIPNQGGKFMPAVFGSFSGNVKVQTALAVTDQSNHERNVAEISGTQKSKDENWNNSAITFWGITDMLKAKAASTVISST